MAGAMIRYLPLLALPLVCAGCGDRAADRAPAAPATAAAAPVGDDTLARMAALPPRQRDGVLFRAIRDAGHDCQEVTETKAQPPGDGTIGWLATCDRAEQWLVTIDRSGTATVLDARAAAGAAR